MEKYHKTDIAPVEQENERDETYRASNPQIDCSRTNGNYHIIKRQRSYTQFINDKIEALYLPTKVRKDAVLTFLWTEMTMNCPKNGMLITALVYAKKRNKSNGGSNLLHRKRS